VTEPLSTATAQWVHTIGDLRTRWFALGDSAQGLGEDWALRLEQMRERMDDLSRQGRWASGPHDLLSVVGLHRWELAHNAALAWLFNPHASHGLGSTFLEGLIAMTGDPVDLGGPVVCRTEVSRQRSRADVVVEGSGWVLVIEVKVDASEGLLQAQRLYDDWAEDGDVRFVFLTRHGQRPVSADEAARDAWVALSWRTTRGLLRALTSTADQSAHGRRALAEYMHTLDSTF